MRGSMRSASTTARRLKATRHLIDMGHRRIGILDSSTPMGNLEKCEGYQQALAKPASRSIRAGRRPHGHYATRGY